jgi:hydroxypyruvate isomerase
MDEVSFAHHFFDRAADDQAVGSLRAAAMETVEAETRSQLAAASKHLADAMKAVGLDRWKGFVSGAQTSAHDKATLAAIQKSRQPVLRVSAAVAFRVSGKPG